LPSETLLNTFRFVVGITATSSPYSPSFSRVCGVLSSIYFDFGRPVSFICVLQAGFSPLLRGHIETGEGISPIQSFPPHPETNLSPFPQTFLRRPLFDRSKLTLSVCLFRAAKSAASLHASPSRFPLSPLPWFFPHVSSPLILRCG